MKFAVRRDYKRDRNVCLKHPRWWIEKYQSGSGVNILYVPNKLNLNLPIRFLPEVDLLSSSTAFCNFLKLNGPRHRVLCSSN